MSSNIPENSVINDIRNPGDFKGITFSKYKRVEVRNSLIDNLLKGKFEPACHWAAELICAGHYMELWETILYYMGKHIHLGNPKLVIYLEMRYEIFRNIMAQGLYINELQLRNNGTIRSLFGEIIAMLTISNKKHSFEPVKINRMEEFDITQMTDRLKAPSVLYIQDIFQKEDPKEIYIPMNEFAYHVSKDSKNTISACYWIEWMIEFDNICKKRKEPCFCQRRMKPPVENKFQKDIIWLIWDTLIEYGNKLENVYISKLMMALFNLFCIKYTTASCKKRRYLLYFGVALLTETVPADIDIITDKTIVQNIVQNINEIYKQIKKGEMSPNTDYLFTGMDSKSNFEKSVKKLEIMGNMDNFLSISELR